MPAATLRDTIRAKTTRRKLVAVADRPQPNMKRLAVVGCLLLAWGGAVAWRLVTCQVYQHQFLAERAEQQQQRVVSTTARRGTIADRNGRELARSVEVASIYVSPKQVPKTFRNFDDLARLLDLPVETVRERLTSSKVFVCLKRKVEDAAAETIRTMNIPGLQFVTETKRYYPKDELGSTVLGFVNLEDEGAAGVEQQFDKHLKGTSGKYVVESDAKGRPFRQDEQASEGGQSLVLTLDERIQYKTEKILRETVETTGAKNALAVVMKPGTGEILAMASLPGFNPNDQVKDAKDLREKRRNHVVEDSYEPGSVFKVVTYSAALEEKLLAPDRPIDCQGGSITIAGHTIRDGGGYGRLTTAEAFQVSSNVAAIKTGRMLGKERLLKYVERFGFGRPTNVGLPGESPGSIGGASRWTDMSFASLPMGYEVTVTPIQLAGAVAALANDGVWVQPHVLQRVVSTTGDVLHETQPETERVVSKQTAEEMRRMLQGVVEKGTAKAAKLDGYTAGGKTGTAKKFDHRSGKYSETRYFASFVGLAPVERPAVVVAVVIDEPPFGQHHGGQAAAPVFKRIVEATLPIVGVSPDVNLKTGDLLASTDIPEEADPFDPPAAGLRQATMTTLPAVTEIKSGPRRPDAPTPPPTSAVVTLDMPTGGIQMPDLRGQGLRATAAYCARLGIKLNSTGFGVVVEQSPPPGASIPLGGTCTVRLGEPSAEPPRKT